MSFDHRSGCSDSRFMTRSEMLHLPVDWGGHSASWWLTGSVVLAALLVIVTQVAGKVQEINRTVFGEQIISNSLTRDISFALPSTWSPFAGEPF